MRILIAGGGVVGYHLAKNLENESHEIVLIDIDEERKEIIEGNLDIFALQGDATSPHLLKEAKVEKTDLFIAVTGRENANISAAIIGKQLGAKKTIARISNREFLHNDEKLDWQQVGIDELILPEALAAKEVQQLLDEPNVTDTFEFEGGKLLLMGIHLEVSAPLIDKTVQQADQMTEGKNFVVVAIIRQGKTIIPQGNTKFQAGDLIYFITLDTGEEQILEISGKKPISINSLIILGGSATGTHIAQQLSDNYKIKLIEKDREKSKKLAKKLSNVLVVNGDGTDIEMLREEAIEDTDAFVSVTANSETNIFSCLMAKELGVKRTIASVENIGLTKLSQTIGIDTLINKKLAAANSIFRSIRRGEVINLTKLQGVEAEILEFEVTAHSPITEQPIKDLNFPAQAMIGGVVREQKGHIALGDFHIQENDRVVVFTLPESLPQVESYFESNT